MKFSRLPGWEPNSWGYHGDDGCSFAAEKNGTSYGPTYGGKFKFTLLGFLTNILQLVILLDVV